MDIEDKGPVISDKAIKILTRRVAHEKEFLVSARYREDLKYYLELMAENITIHCIDLHEALGRCGKTVTDDLLTQLKDEGDIPSWMIN